MNFPSVGSRLRHSTCSFTAWAPFRKKLEVVLDETGTAHPMTRDAGGYWMAALDGIKPGARYWFRLDGDKVFPDPASRSQPDGIHAASAVVAEAFSWRDQEWRGLPLEEMVIYELHVGTFSPSRNFEGVTARIPHLKALGVNAIELMPIAQFPGERNWGYDGVFPFAAQNSYGGSEGLKKLVDAAHTSGIAVILDVVYNHQGPEGNYLSEFGPYFTDKYKTGWGQAINYDDAWCDGVRNFYYQNALMWLDEFHIDGLRLDAVHSIWDFSAAHFMEELSEKVDALEKRSGRRKLLIAELDANNPRYILPKENGGYGLHGQWNDDFHHALHSLLTGEVDGYYEDFGTVDHLVRAFRDAYVYTGQFSLHRKRHFGRKPIGTGPNQFVVFAQNHDQVGNRMLGDRLSTQVSNEALKLAAATYLLSPYVPMLFMGEEYGEKNPFQYFISHGDEGLAEAVHRGRKKEFASFQWKGEVPDPQSQGTFDRCMLSWSMEHADARDLFSVYQFLVRFRKERPAMQGRATAHINITHEEEVICMERESGRDYILVLLHFGKRARSYHPPLKGNLRKIFDSAHPGGATDKANTVSHLPIELNPQSAVILESC